MFITGDTRSFDPAVQDLLDRRIRALATGIATAHGATYTHEFAPTVNDAACTDTAVAAARAAPGDKQVDGQCAPVMASEDFGVLARHVTACLAILGNGTVSGEGGTPLHSSAYVINDRNLSVGVAIYGSVVRRILSGRSRVRAAISPVLAAPPRQERHPRRVASTGVVSAARPIPQDRPRRIRGQPESQHSRRCP